MKFVMTTSCYSPVERVADEKHIQNLADELIKKGHEVHIFYSWNANRFKKYAIELDSTEIRKDANGSILHPVVSPAGLFDPYLGYVLGTSPFVEHSFNNLIQDVKPDVVHHHNIFFLGHTILRKRAKYLCLYTPHDYWLICTHIDLLKNGNTICESKSCMSCGLNSMSSKRIPQLWRWSHGYKRSIQDIDLILAPSQFMKDKLKVELNNRIEHLPPFVTPPEHIKKSQFSNYFLYAGVLSRHKGLEDLMQTYQYYGEQINKKLIIVGRGGLKDEIQEFIERYKLEDKVLFAGFVNTDQLWSLYRDTEAVIVPSIWYENCPAVALEPLSLGVPVIGSDIGGIPEILNKIDNNLIFKAGDIKGLSDKLITFDKNKYKPDDLKSVYRAYYSAETFISGYESIINSVLSDKFHHKQ